MIKNPGLLKTILRVSRSLLLLFPAVTAAQSISLAEALQKALTQNTAIQALQNQEQASHYQVREAQSGHLPKVSVSGSYTYYEKPNIIFPIHQQGVFPPLDDRIFETSAQLVLPLFSGGKVMASVQAAKAGRKNALARRQAQETDVLRHVAEIFLNGAELRDRQQLIRARLDVLYQRLAEMDALSREGRVSAADRALILSAIATALSDSMNLNAAWQETGWRLGQLLGMQQMVFPELTGLDAETMSSSNLPQTMPDDGLSSNSLVLQAQSRVQQAEALQKLNTRTFLPDLSGFAVYNYRSGGTDWDPDGEWAAGIRLSLPVFDGGKRLAGWQASKSSLRAAEQSLQATIQNEYTSLQIARERWHSALHQRESLTEAVRQKNEYVKAQQAVYQAGRLPLSELMNQETELLQLTLQEKSQLYAARRNALTYYAAAGQLTEETIFNLLGRTN